MGVERAFRLVKGLREFFFFSFVGFGGLGFVNGVGLVTTGTVA